MKKKIAKIIFCGFWVFVALFFTSMAVCMVWAAFLSVESDPKGFLHAARGGLITMLIIAAIVWIVSWAEENK